MFYTDRLVIRTFEKTKNDITGLFNIMSDVEVNRFLPWYPVVNKEEAAAFYDNKILPVNQKEKEFFYAVCKKDENFPIGYLTLHGEESHDFGYGLCKEFWGKGYITEASLRVFKELKKQNCAYITATCDVRNQKSEKVMKRLHMSYKYSYEEFCLPKEELVTFKLYQLNFDHQERTYEGYWNKYQNHFI